MTSLSDQCKQISDASKAHSFKDMESNLGDRSNTRNSQGNPEEILGHLNSILQRLVHLIRIYPRHICLQVNYIQIPGVVRRSDLGQAGMK
jgi:hypothetical protein